MADGTSAIPGEGHFTAPATEPAPTTAPATGGSPDYDAFNSLKSDKPLTLQERLNSFKERAAVAAKQAYESTAAATAQVKQKAAARDWSKESQVLGRAQQSALGAAEKVGAAATAGGNWLWNAGSKAGNALKGDAIGVLAKTEASTRPCPRTVLVCCAALLTTGPATPKIFEETVAQDLVHFLLNSFEDGHGCFLPPPGTSPHVIANVLKAFFSTLPEPLLTYKVLPAITEAGEISADTAALAPPLLMELPAANLNALWILLELLNRVAAEAADNDMDARALAAALAPTLAWHPPPPKTLSQGGVYQPAQSFDEPHVGLDDDDHPTRASPPGTPGSTVRRDLSDEELASVSRVLEYFIINYGALSRRVYWTPSGQPALLPD
mmetsp:Transcript_19495/g.58933  ORF Transcript_19495/g.58933 Transcript_19495/m.58933 type:complete len:381 (-) Transcript_19495:390-1532(-)|eukprot:CAMPEP_0206140750 /NCGR_PEP_ID=MMETSP1473-20131121/10544_1 /ASSEMBLY_ACC=CAM_ASM_001109 /TAXON_ID=1461547 /ORGANISM="Stichococcus sp, Strain RCC1054" /LENGTH=380 /DNA_ID=CAMNT_0053535023 /DNA_START=72 /DNA_END=1214 /DNA_ORIENTATION=-